MRKFATSSSQTCRSARCPGHACPNVTQVRHPTMTHSHAAIRASTVTDHPADAGQRTHMPMSGCLRPFLRSPITAHIVRRCGSGRAYSGRRSYVPRAGLPSTASYSRRFGRKGLGRPGAPVVGMAMMVAQRRRVSAFLTEAHSSRHVSAISPHTVPGSVADDPTREPLGTGASSRPRQPGLR